MASTKGKAKRPAAPAPDSSPAVGKVVALAARKGGVGKSTIACCLAAEAWAKGLRVLLVDADPQATSMMWAASRAKREQSEQSSLFPPVTVRPMGAEMLDDLPPLARGVDLVIVDCPGWADAVQRAAVMVADLVLLPSAPTAFDAWSLASSLAPLHEAKRVRPELDMAILIARKQVGTAQAEGARDLFEQVGLPVLKTELGQRVAFSEATAAGQAVSAYAPKSEATREIKALLAEVLERLGLDRHGKRGQG